MLKPRGLVPWGLPGPTRGRRGRDAAVFNLASKTKPPSQGPGTPVARMEGPSRGHGARESDSDSPDSELFNLNNHDASHGVSPTL